MIGSADDSRFYERQEHTPFLVRHVHNSIVVHLGWRIFSLAGEVQRVRRSTMAAALKGL